MRKVVGIVAVILVAAACGGSSDTATTLAPTDSTAPAGDTTTTAAIDPTTTLTAETTTTASAAPSGATFAITQVGLDVLGQVVVQNVGSEPASLAGHWLCQRPSYWEFPDVELQPGESAAVAVPGRDDIFGPPSGAIAIEGVASIGSFDPTSGEVGLYSSGDFGSPEAIVSYIEWGNSGHGRSGTAVSAGIWSDGGFVATTEGTGAILATQIPPTDPSHWTTG